MRIAVFCLSVAVAACAPAALPAGDGAALPPAAVRAFQDHLLRMSEGRLTCSAAHINAAPHLAADLNGDGRSDYVIDAARLNCRPRSGARPENYFCGFNICAFPLLVSEGESWRVIPLMSGNSAELTEHYRETRVRVSQGNFGLTGGNTILVREYAWRNGEWTRIAERQELPAS